MRPLKPSPIVSEFTEANKAYKAPCPTLGKVCHRCELDRPLKDFSDNSNVCRHCHRVETMRKKNKALKRS